MSTNRNKRRKSTMSATTQNEYLPPGAPDPAPVEQAHPVDDYPAVTIKNEAEHNAQEEAAAEARVERAKSVSSPKRLSQNEMLNIGLLLKLLPEGESVPLDTPIPLESLPVELRNTFFDVGSKNNLAQRGIVKLIMNPETKQFDALVITDIAYHIYQTQSNKLAPKQKRVAKEQNGEPRAPRGRTSNLFAGLRLRKLQDNPRPEGTMGYFSWQLYQDGMTYNEYMAIKEFPEAKSKRTGEKFRGPGRNHWDWDLMHGFTGLYRENEPEFNEDGTPNPNFWAVKNTPSTTAPKQEPTQEAVQPTETTTVNA